MPIRKTPCPALLSLCLFAVLGAGLSFATGCGDSKRSPADEAAYQADQQAKPLEYKVARLDQGADPPDGDLTIPKIKSLLARLTATYDRPPQGIVDATSAAQKEMEGQGIVEGLQDIMEDMDQVFILPTHGQSYSTYLAAYTAAREKGISREKSVEALRGLI